MSRTNNIRRNTLIFFAWGPLVGGLGMILLFVASFDYPLALYKFFDFGMFLMGIFFIIGCYVVGALPALATGLIFAFVASRHTLKLLHSILLGAAAGFLTSAIAVVVIAWTNPGVPSWNWIIPGTGVLAGALCGGYCWVVERRQGRYPAKNFH